MLWGIIFYTMEISCYFSAEIRHKQEKEADEFAAYLLVPEEELKKVRNIEIKDSAIYFGISDEMFRLRLTIYREKRKGNT